MPPSLQRACIIELLGAALLVFIICLASVNAGPLAPIAIGFGLAALVYMGGPVSGAHYNPAVSICLAYAGAMPKPSLIPYVISQTIGGLVGAGLASVVIPVLPQPAPNPEFGTLAAMIVEIIFTGMLCKVVLGVAASPAAKGHDYYGLAIGATVMVGAFAAGPISGGVFNPAVGIGLLVVGLADGSSIGPLWIYLIGPTTGAIAAALFAPVILGPTQPSKG